MHDKIIGLGQGREDQAVRSKARSDEQGALAAEKARCLGLQRLVLHRIASQQTRSPGPERHTTLQRLDSSVAQVLRSGEAEIIVRGKVAPRRKHEATATVDAFEGVEIVTVEAGNHGRRRLREAMRW